MNPRSALKEKYMQKLDLGFYPWVCDICINPNDGCGVFLCFFFCIVSVSAASTDRKSTAIWCQGWATDVFCVGGTVPTT